MPSMKRNRHGWFLSSTVGILASSSSSSFVGSFPLLTHTLCAQPRPSRTRRPSSDPTSSSPWRRVGYVPTSWARREYMYDQDEEDDRYYDSRPFREVGGKGPALRRDDDAEWLDDDDDDDESTYDKPSLYPRRRRYDADDDEYDESNDPNEPESGLYDDEEEEEEPASGNFWFNPKPGLDGPVVRAATGQAQNARRDRADLPPSTAVPRERRQADKSSRNGRPPQGAGKRTTFRSGTPPPPAPIRDLYNRLFWYGFDPSDEASSSPADPTMFGGTKGKFNGLAYLGDGGANMDRPTRRPRNTRRTEVATDDEYDEYDYFEDEYEYDDDEPEAWEEKATNGNEKDGRSSSWNRPPPPQSRAPVTPPYDPPMFMRSPPTEVPYPSLDSKARRRKRRPSARGGGGDWVSREVSSWFGPDDGEDASRYRDDEVERGGDTGREPSRGRRSDRRRSSQPSSWSLFGAVESFLGLDRMDMDARAVEYDRKMGIGRGRSRDGSQRRRQPIIDPEPSTAGPSRRRERRKGYAYPYEDDDGTPPIAEVDALPVQDDDDALAESDEADATKEPARGSGETEMSWEERALAVERVPPAGIPAWGPSGDLGIDARTKAILDALEDIQLAKEVVNERKTAVEKAKEDVAILRIDAELEKKRLRSAVREARALQESIRQLDFEVQESSRALRYAQSRLEMAQKELAALERRHWAVLSFYNPAHVEEAVQDAIREFEQNEPAARLHRDQPEKDNDPLGSSTILSRDGDEEQAMV